MASITCVPVNSFALPDKVVFISKKACVCSLVQVQLLSCGDVAARGCLYGAAPKTASTRPIALKRPSPPKSPSWLRSTQHCSSTCASHHITPCVSSVTSVFYQNGTTSPSSIHKMLAWCSLLSSFHIIPSVASVASVFYQNGTTSPTSIHKMLGCGTGPFTEAARKTAWLRKAQHIGNLRNTVLFAFE